MRYQQRDDNSLLLIILLILLSIVSSIWAWFSQPQTSGPTQTPLQIRFTPGPPLPTPSPAPAPSGPSPAPQPSPAPAPAPSGPSPAPQPSPAPSPTPAPLPSCPQISPAICPSIPSCPICPTPTDCVVGNWSEWSQCNPDTGTQTRTGTVITPSSFGGASCPPLTETRDCPVNCVVGNWSSWSECNKSNGTRTRTRSVITTSKYGGDACPALTETQDCPVDCEITWPPTFSACNQSTGTQTKTATISVHPLKGGAECPPLTMTQDCPVNCVFNNQWIDDPNQSGVNLCVEKRQIQTVSTPALKGGSCITPTRLIPVSMSEWSPPADPVPFGTPCGQVTQTRTVPPGCSADTTRTVSTCTPSTCPPNNTAAWCEYNNYITIGSKAANFLTPGTFPSYPTGTQADVDSILSYINSKGTFATYPTQFRTITGAVTTLQTTQAGISCHDPCN